MLYFVKLFFFMYNMFLQKDLNHDLIKHNFTKKVLEIYIFMRCTVLEKYLLIFKCYIMQEIYNILLHIFSFLLTIYPLKNVKTITKQN